MEDIDFFAGNTKIKQIPPGKMHVGAALFACVWILSSYLSLWLSLELAIIRGFCVSQTYFVFVNIHEFSV